MKSLHYLKKPLILFLVGFLIRFAGVTFKIRHWPNADEIIMIGSIICAGAIIFAIIKLLKLKDQSR